MAQKLGFFSQWMFGEWADRAAINANADDLMNVEITVGALQTTVARQHQEILRLRAMVMGVVDVLNEKFQLDEREVEKAVQQAWAELTMPAQPPQPVAMPTDPYRGTPAQAQPTAPAAPTRYETCTKCGQNVPAARTNITANGVVCDRCS
jgi:hypothetical protein